MRPGKTVKHRACPIELLQAAMTFREEVTDSRANRTPANKHDSKGFFIGH
jgi:hypothetical protein